MGIGLRPSQRLPERVGDRRACTSTRPTTSERLAMIQNLSRRSKSLRGWWHPPISKSRLTCRVIGLFYDQRLIERKSFRVLRPFVKFHQIDVGPRLTVYPYEVGKLDRHSPLWLITEKCNCRRYPSVG